MSKKEVTLKKLEVAEFFAEKSETLLRVAYSSDNENKVMLFSTKLDKPEVMATQLIQQIKEQEKDRAENTFVSLPLTITNLEAEQEKMHAFFTEHLQRVAQYDPNKIKNQKVSFLHSKGF